MSSTLNVKRVRQNDKNRFGIDSESILYSLYHTFYVVQLDSSTKKCYNNIQRRDMKGDLLMKMRKQMENPADRLAESTTMLVLGASGSGKTTLAASVGVIGDKPSKLLFIDNDNGSGAVPLANPALIPESFSDYKTIVNAITSAVRSQGKPPYKMKLAGEEFEFNGVVIDTLNAAQDVIRAEIKGGWMSDRQIRIQDYGTMLDRLAGLILQLRELSSTHPFHFVATAQITPEKVTLVDGDGDTSAYHWTASLAGKIGKKLPEFFDMVLTTYVNPKTSEHIVFSGDKVTDRGTFIGKMRYGHLMTPPSPTILSKRGGRVTWEYIVRLHGVDLDETHHTQELSQAEVSWVDDPEKRALVTATLDKNEISIEDALARNGCENWDDVRAKKITGSEFISAAKQGE